MERRVDDTVDFLKSVEPSHLPDNLLPSAQTIADGKKIFARACMTCHSSRQPEVLGRPELAADPMDPASWFTDERIAFFLDQVQSSNWPGNDYLSNDKRYPLTFIGTNLARALGTNAVEGHIWASYASQTYKDLPSVDVSVALLGGAKLPAPGGGRGFFRPTSLWNVWNSAPFLHNNGLGIFNGEVSIDGRLAAYQDAAIKLLFPERRDGDKTIRRAGFEAMSPSGSLREFTDAPAKSSIEMPGIPAIPVPKGAKVDVLFNLGSAVDAIKANSRFLVGSVAAAFAAAMVDFGKNLLFGAPEDAAEVLLKAFDRVFANDKDLSTIMKATDPVQDHGHLFGTDQAEIGPKLTAQERQTLVEFMKLF
jgi:hypothetical protein